MTQLIVRIVELNLIMSQITKICEDCCCIDSEDNPMIEIWDDEGYVKHTICMMCYVERENNGTLSELTT